MPFLVKMLIGVLSVVLLGAVVVIGYFGVGPMLMQPVQPASQTDTADADALVHPSQVSQTALQTVQLTEEQMKNLLTAVGRLASLPQEVPQVAVIQDVAALSNEPFFHDAAKDDAVLTFQTTKLVLLYRPSADKIVAQGTFQPQASASANQR